MAAPEPVDLSPGEWAVLGVVAEGPTHGFAVAQLVGPAGELGRIWTLPRPFVYQALKKLTAAGFIAARATEASDRGPQRTIVAATAAGRGAVAAWLSRPVDHVRDIRSLFLLKLALLDRAGADARSLVAAQHRALVPQVAGLEARRDQAEGFERTLAAWRLESCHAAIRFLAAWTPQPAERS
ncbi:MAG: PadR family transcriptional regulator [Acidimicrobiales bacterium]